MHDAQMRAALGPKDNTRSPNKNKNLGKSTTSKGGGNKRSLKNTPLRGQTRGSKGPQKSKKTSISSRYNTHDFEGGDDDEAADILE